MRRLIRFICRCMEVEPIQKFAIPGKYIYLVIPPGSLIVDIRKTDCSAEKTWLDFTYSVFHHAPIGDHILG